MLEKGMVHALEEAHRLIRPTGRLVDIHPLPTATIFEIRVKNRVTYSLLLPGESYADIQHAENALLQVVRNGLFQQENVCEFNWHTHASSLQELIDQVTRESTFEDQPCNELLALQKNEFGGLIEKARLAAGGVARIVRINPTRMTGMKPIM